MCATRIIIRVGKPQTSNPITGLIVFDIFFFENIVKDNVVGRDVNRASKVWVVAPPTVPAR